MEVFGGLDVVLVVVGPVQVREPWGHCLLADVYRLPRLTILGGFGSRDHCVLNRLVIGIVKDVEIGYWENKDRHQIWRRQKIWAVALAAVGARLGTATRS